MAVRYAHIHKYVREKFGQGHIYKCALAGCPHYLVAKLAVGKVSICNYCDKEFVMTKESAKLKKPHCPNCVVAHNAKPRLADSVPAAEKHPAAEAVQDFLSNLTKNEGAS